MSKVTRLLSENLYSLLFLTIIFGSLYLAESLSIDVKSLIGENRITGAITLALLMYISTVLAPITMLPVLPMVAPMLGPFVTGLASWAGWTLGAVTAFWIARHGGRPMLKRIMDVEKLARFESRMPEEGHFFVILALRLVLPVDLLSYALGLFSTVSLTTYTMATGIGILWFSFAFSYLGSAFESGNTVLFVLYGVASLIIFLGALFYVVRTMKR
jgi:uncharacterized membrane protein YdjX (TVP38/TMEM64 family)